MLILIFEGSQDEATNIDDETTKAIDQIEYETTNRNNNNDSKPEAASKRERPK